MSRNVTAKPAVIEIVNDSPSGSAPAAAAAAAVPVAVFPLAGWRLIRRTASDRSREPDFNAFPSLAAGSKIKFPFLPVMPPVTLWLRPRKLSFRAMPTHA
jgi:hypothetical protein